jgi:RNA polymerase sigma-70 factor, ECF subfamily
METQIVASAYHDHRRELLAFLVSKTGDRDLAEDALQESYARLANEVQAGRPPREVRAWLYRVARNVVVSSGRRQQVANRYRERIRLETLDSSAEEQCLMAHRSRRLHSLLALLSETDRRSLVMAAEGYTAAEIGQVTGRRADAVRTKLHRARLRLRRQIEADPTII